MNRTRNAGREGVSLLAEKEKKKAIVVDERERRRGSHFEFRAARGVIASVTGESTISTPTTAH
jgi:hypothetical protein